jgi:hypothetical protein
MALRAAAVTLAAAVLLVAGLPPDKPAYNQQLRIQIFYSRTASVYTGARTSCDVPPGAAPSLRVPPEAGTHFMTSITSIACNGSELSHSRLDVVDGVDIRGVNWWQREVGLCCVLPAYTYSRPALHIFLLDSQQQRVMHTFFWRASQ